MTTDCIFLFETITDQPICVLGNDTKQCAKSCKDFEEGSSA